MVETSGGLCLGRQISHKTVFLGQIKTFVFFLILIYQSELMLWNNYIYSYLPISQFDPLLSQNNI